MKNYNRKAELNKLGYRLIMVSQIGFILQFALLKMSFWTIYLKKVSLKKERSFSSEFDHITFFLNKKDKKRERGKINF